MLPKNQSKSDINLKLPPVGTYNPTPVSFNLFENAIGAEKKKARSFFNK
jgi:hypothetical protein